MCRKYNINKKTKYVMSDDVKGKVEITKIEDGKWGGGVGGRGLAILYR